jgi:tetratricopeptide (TPR) repeat protein
VGPRDEGNARNAYDIARLSVLGGKPPVEAARVLKLAEFAVKAEPTAWYLHTLGLVHYRAGNDEEAVRYFTRSVTEHPEWAAQVLNFQGLALAYHRQGKDDEARRWRERAAQWIERTGDSAQMRTTGRWPLHQHDLLAMWLLERELAEAMPAPQAERAAP